MTTGLVEEKRQVTLHCQNAGDRISSQLL